MEVIEMELRKIYGKHHGHLPPFQFIKDVMALFEEIDNNSLARKIQDMVNDMEKNEDAKDM